MMADEEHEPSVTIIGPRRRGRPPAEEPGASLSVWLPHSHYDRLTKIAHKHGVSMSAVVRQMIVLQLHRK